MKLRVALLSVIAAVLGIYVSTQDLHELQSNLSIDIEAVKFGLHIWQWTAIAGVLATSALLGYAAFALCGSLMHVRGRFAAPHSTTATRLGVSRSTGLLAGILFWHFVLPDLSLPAGWLRWSSFTIEGISVAASVWLVFSLWDGLCDAMAGRAAQMDRRAEKLLVPLTRKLVRFLIIIGGSLIGMAWMGANVAGVIAGLGIGGLAVALAAKDSVENVFGSLTILFDMPFAIGDWVKIDAVDGVVEEINLRSTRIRTAHDSLITLPNSNLIKASVENYGARRFRRVKGQWTVPCTTPVAGIEGFCKELREFIEARPAIRKDSLYVTVSDLTDAGLVVLIQFFVECETYEQELAERSVVWLRAADLGRAHGFGAAPAPG